MAIQRALNDDRNKSRCFHRQWTTFRISRAFCRVSPRFWTLTLPIHSFVESISFPNSFAREIDQSSRDADSVSYPNFIGSNGSPRYIDSQITRTSDLANECPEETTSGQLNEPKVVSSALCTCRERFRQSGLIVQGEILVEIVDVLGQGTLVARHPLALFVVLDTSHRSAFLVRSFGRVFR